MLQLVEYVCQNIDYIDRDRIGITGHSTGGRNVSFTLDAYGRNEHGKVYADQPADAGGFGLMDQNPQRFPLRHGNFNIHNLYPAHIRLNQARADAADA